MYFQNGIITNATVSTRSPIKNLVDINQNIQMDKLLSAIGWEYLRTKALVLEDGRYDLVEQQKGFKFVNPTENWFPGMYGKYYLNMLEIKNMIDFKIILYTLLSKKLSNIKYRVFRRTRTISCVENGKTKLKSLPSNANAQRSWC